MQVPLSSIKGTGPDGRIVKADIEDYIGILFLSSISFICLMKKKTIFLQENKRKRKQSVSVGG
jgi:hypothetical protein